MTKRFASIYQVFQWVSLFLFLLFSTAAIGDVPGSINIQGALQAQGGGPGAGDHDFQVRFFESAAGGAAIGTVTGTTTVSGAGRFSIELVPPAAVLTSLEAWYELAIDSDDNGIDGNDVFPNRVKVHSVPFALKAGDSDSLGGLHATVYTTDAEFAAGLATTATSGHTHDAGDTISGAFEVERLPNEVATDTELSDGLAGKADVTHNHDAVYWGLSGNDAAPGQFLGTTNDQALRFKANNQTALRLISNATSPNVIGGYEQNNLLAGVVGGVIAGGGTSNYHGGGSSYNLISGDYGAIVGGTENRAGEFAFVGGGEDNSALGRHATVGGGEGNEASLRDSTVGGGRNNEASGYNSTVAGGAGNRATGANAMVAGGASNTATGENSFAAGHHACAVHDGSFVWADWLHRINPPFYSIAEGEFAIQAHNGLRLSEDAPPPTEKDVGFGEYYRDNGIVAWAKVSSNLLGTATFGISRITHNADPPGIYSIQIAAEAVNASSLVPIAVAEIDNPPMNANSVRIVSINQLNTAPYNRFDVYINDGNWNLVDNDFVFMVTGR